MARKQPYSQTFSYMFEVVDTRSRKKAIVSAMIAITTIKNCMYSSALLML